MIAEIVSIGTELLLGEIQDTNAGFLSRELCRLGFQVFFRATVGDNPNRLRHCLKTALDRSDLVITTGGLGPTEGDITRESVAGLFQEDIYEDPALRTTLEELFRKHGRTMARRNLKQASLIPSATSLPNAVGTAPGWFVRKNGKSVICLPGPSHEMQHVWTHQALPRLQVPQTAFFIHQFHLLGIGESNVIDLLGDLPKQSNPTTATYSKAHGLDLRICSSAPTLAEAQTTAEPIILRIRNLLSPFIFGENGGTLSQAVLDHLKFGNSTLGVIEGVSQGMLCRSLLVGGPAAEPFHGGIILNPASPKSVEQDFIHSLPSGEEGRQALILAERAKTQTQSTWGIANFPGADFTVQNGVASGTVHIAVSGPTGNFHELFVCWTQTASFLAERVAAQTLFTLFRELNRSNSSPANHQPQQ
jgi:nicotinamide-nucleotide amidase